VLLCKTNVPQFSDIQFAVKIIINLTDNTLVTNTESSFYTLAYNLNVIRFLWLFSSQAFTIPSPMIECLPEKFKKDIHKYPNAPTSFIVMQRHYSFKQFLQENQSSINSHQVIWYCSEIANALLFLWKNNIVHCGLKLDDILLSSDGYPIVCDLGSAIVVDGSTGCAENVKVLGGNLSYLAPEVLNSSLDKVNYTKQPSWELGVIIYEISTLQHPFLQYPIPAIYGSPPMVSVEGKLSLDVIKGKANENLLKLVLLLLENDPTKRIDIEQATNMLDLCLN